MSDTSAPRVSVVIPVYNGTNYLRESIESVLAQTYSDYELIVVDDGSTDETWALIQSYGSRVSGVHKDNGGTSSALNCGIQQARGEFIAWLSHDDVFLPNKLERQIAFLDSAPDLAGCYSDYFIIDAKGIAQREMVMPHFPPDQMARHLLQWMFINGCTVLVRRACFASEGLFDHRLLWAHDADMWFRILRRYAFGHIPEPLTNYRVHATQESRKLTKMRSDAHEFWRRCLEDYPLTDTFPELAGREKDVVGFARAHNCLGDIMRICHADMSLARREYIQSLRIWFSARNPAFWRGVTLQFWLPDMLWVIRKAIHLLRQTRPPAPRSNLIERDEAIQLASNAVACARV